MVSTRREMLATVGSVGAVTLAGCASGDGGGGQETTTTTTSNGGSGDTTTTQSDSDGGTSTTVTMKNTAFDPVQASVDTGATVKWVNDDGFEHDVTSAQITDAAASWDFAKTLSGGGEATYTFDSAGVYQYYCTIHGESTMCGAVIVGDASFDASLPCEDSGGTTTTEGGGY